MSALRQSLQQNGYGDDLLNWAGLLFYLAIPVALFGLALYCVVRFVKWAWTRPA